MGETLLVGQADADRRAEHAGGAFAARFRQAGVFQRVVLADIEVDVDRVLRDDGRQDRIAGVVAAPAHEVAAGDERAADAAGDRRRDAAEAELELGRLDPRLRYLNRGLRLAHDVLAVVEDLLGDVVALQERAPALDVEVRVADRDLGLVELGARLLDRALEGARVDLEQQVAFLDLLAVLEPDLGQIAADARPHVDGLDRVEAARVLVPLDDAAGDRLGDRDLRRLLLAVLAGARRFGVAAQPRHRRGGEVRQVTNAGFHAAALQRPYRRDGAGQQEDQC